MLARITAYMNYALGTLGIKTVLAGSPSGVDREILSFAGPRDAAVAVSFTPYAPTTVEYTRQIVGQGAPLVAITDSPFSPLALNTSVWFEIVESDFEGFRTLGGHHDPGRGADDRGGGKAARGRQAAGRNRIF